MNALNGRFGSLSLEQTYWFAHMASAVVMAPKDSDLRREAERLLNRACQHYGVNFRDAYAREEDLPAVTA